MGECEILTSSYKLKVLLCGPAGSGKRGLIMKYIKSRFQTDYKLTVGVDILTKDVELANNNVCTLNIWDIGGQERFSFIRSTFYKGAAGALLVFDLSRAATWDEIKNWRAEVKQFSGDIPFILIGNNLDQITHAEEGINRNECKAYAESQGSEYIETSPKESSNVDQALIALTKKIVGQ
ncbi:MAG: GTP-binding protein [Promethearchaeota archaeon]|nr:MAG: GTP-binding protein [Candidatus Lokiarchaeota archaeon]